MPRAWISIGSNIDAHNNVAGAIRELRKTFGDVMLSPVYEARAVGFDGPAFVNLVAGIETELPAAEVARRLGDIEARFGRVRGEAAFSSRTLDLDLLTYGNTASSVNGKPLPREDILKYAFVLRPLAEVAPNERHAMDGRTYAEIWSAFGGDTTGLKPVDPKFLEESGAGNPG